MSFKLETTDMDLGDTPIENIFINDYMPMANGTYVKVYLLGYKYAQDKDEDIEVSNETIARHLNIPMEDVLRSWDFWEEKGIIEKIGDIDGLNYRVKFLNLKQLYIRNNIGLLRKDTSQKVVKKEDTRSQVKEIIEANKIPEINDMFNNIDDLIRRQTQATEKRRILSWINDYNMTPEVVEKAFTYCVEVMGKKNINYVEAVVRSWYDEGITQIDDVLELFKVNNEKYYRYLEVMKSLGLNRRPIKDEEKRIIDKWFEEYNFTMELVLAACERDLNPTPSVKYVNGILESWKKKGIEQVEDIEKLDVRETKKDNIRYGGAEGQGVIKKTGFHNFKQRSDEYSAEELDEIAKRKRKEQISKLMKEK